MLKSLRLTNVGPAPTMELDFGRRLNLLTGDNGLGKSFLLDIAWWSLTRKWPAEVNPRLTTGKAARPSGPAEARIRFSFAGKTRPEDYTSTYSRRAQAWTGRAGRPANPGLVLYAMSDGSFAIWDPSRNYWRKRDGVDVQERRPAYVFDPAEVWDGLPGDNGTWLCNGLIRDWAGWQKEGGASFEHLKRLLRRMSPSGGETLAPGELTRISLDDARDIPTIRMPYRQDVAVVHASAGMRRIMALAYCLVWAWEEHKRAASQLGEDPSGQITFLIDEIESHLHPTWQRSVVPAVLSAMQELNPEAEAQLVAATHSPLIMASIEPEFAAVTDAWFDLDFEEGGVVLRRRDFEKRGDAATWLISEAFDLPSGRPLEYERLVDKAQALLNQQDPDVDQITLMNDKLLAALNAKDYFLLNWRYICRQKGWLK